MSAESPSSKSLNPFRRVIRRFNLSHQPFSLGDEQRQDLHFKIRIVHRLAFQMMFIKYWQVVCCLNHCSSFSCNGPHA